MTNAFSRKQRAWWKPLASRKVQTVGASMNDRFDLPAQAIGAWLWPHTSKHDAWYPRLAFFSIATEEPCFALYAPVIDALFGLDCLRRTSLI
jgi:hypothetical protein